MHRPTSLTDLLKLTIGLHSGLPVVTTRSFAAWGVRDAGTVRDIPPDGLWLVDTRDNPDETSLRSAPFEAALVLAGRGRPGSPLRRLLRRIRRRVRPRWSESRTLSALDGRMTHVQRLAFDDGLEVPIGFDLERPDSTGAAFLVTRREPFSGPLWTHVAERLGVDVVDVVSFQLRARGAAVIIVRAADRQRVVRLIPEGPLQQIVLKNHSALVELRRELSGNSELLRLIPEPLFADDHGGIAVLGETCLRGILAWQAVTPALAPVIHRNAVACLNTLMSSTAAAVSGSQAADMLRSDEQMIAQSSFVSDVVRGILTREIERGRDMIGSGDITAYRSHGDYGYGNILVDPASGAVEGVIDWDTTRRLDLPGIDRVNLEIQIRRTVNRESFPAAVQSVWKQGLAAEALGDDAQRARVLFGLALCRYVTRAMQYPELYRRSEPDFARALEWLERTSA